MNFPLINEMMNEMMNEMINEIHFMHLCFFFEILSKVVV